jgi:hypothetical protein
MTMAGDPMDPKIAAERLNERAKGTNVEARGTRFVEVSAERTVAELAFRPDLAQLTGLFHGGTLKMHSVCLISLFSLIILGVELLETMILIIVGRKEDGNYFCS